jgi:hypothetical protein
MLGADWPVRERHPGLHASLGGAAQQWVRLLQPRHHTGQTGKPTLLRHEKLTSLLFLKKRTSFEAH